MFLIRNARILTMAGSVFNNGYILADKGKIIKLGEINGDVQAALEEYHDCDVIDAGGNTVIPGMIDAHCHIGLWEDSVGFEGDDGNEETDPVTPQMRAIDGVYHSDRAFTTLTPTPCRPPETL